MSKLKENDTIIAAVRKLAGDNNTALNVCLDLLKYSCVIDQDCTCNGARYLKLVDDIGLCGNYIEKFYVKVCGRRLNNVVTLLKAFDLHIITKDDIWEHIHSGMQFDRADLTRILNSFPVHTFCYSTFESFARTVSH